MKNLNKYLLIGFILLCVQSLGWPEEKTPPPNKGELVEIGFGTTYSGSYEGLESAFIGRVLLKKASPKKISDSGEVCGYTYHATVLDVVKGDLKTNSEIDFFVPLTVNLTQLDEDYLVFLSHRSHQQVLAIFNETNAFLSGNEDSVLRCKLLPGYYVKISPIRMYVFSKVDKLFMYPLATRFPELDKYDFTWCSMPDESEGNSKRPTWEKERMLLREKFPAQLSAGAHYWPELRWIILDTLSWRNKLKFWLGLPIGKPLCPLLSEL